MERWAKNVNAAKSAQQQQIQAVIQKEMSEAQQEVTTFSSSNSFSEIRRTGVPLSSALSTV